MEPQAKLAKLRKILAGSVPEDLEALSRSELTDIIVRCESNVSEQEDALAENEHIKAAKDNLKELKGPFTDAIKYQRAKQRYAAILRDLKGGGRADLEGPDHTSESGARASVPAGAVPTLS